MIAVTEIISGQSFESMNLTAEYFRIPIAAVVKSLKSEEPVEVNGRKYIFVYRAFSMKGRTSTASPVQKFPFGKYKYKKISQCTDLSYMTWLIEQPDVNSRLKSAINRRVKELNARLTP
jgi:hypothetical protein